jgi:hypothetical protein
MSEVGQFLRREHISIVPLTVRDILGETIRPETGLIALSGTRANELERTMNGLGCWYPALGAKTKTRRRWGTRADLCQGNRGPITVTKS